VWVRFHVGSGSKADPMKMASASVLAVIREPEVVGFK
jgi:hypothetical protein